MSNDGIIRICGDYKTTVNQVSKVDNYSIPTLGGRLASYPS